MKLMTAAIRKSLPKLYSQEKVKDPIARVKFFNPCGMGTWFATEFDGKDLFFGWAILMPGCGEYGYFSLSELQSVKVMFGLGIERDLYFQPCPISEAIKEYDI
jgi:hypothetical protein